MGNFLKVPYSVDNLKDIRSFVSKRLQELSIPEIEINMMVLAIDEVCANMIIHSKNMNQGEQLEVSVKQEQDGVTFEIKDHGEPFDPNSYQVPDIDEIIRTKRKGGLGLMLVKRIMDQIEFKRENDYTILRLFKKVTLAKYSA
jgi:serine/threonine-protein kinase RsbW